MLNVLDIWYENADCSPIILAGREGYEGAKDGEVTNALLAEITRVAVRGRTIFFGEFGVRYQAAIRQVKNLESLADELNIIESILNSFGMLSDKESRANRDKAQAVNTRTLTDAILIADNAGAKLQSKMEETK